MLNWLFGQKKPVEQKRCCGGGSCSPRPVVRPTSIVNEHPRKNDPCLPPDTLVKIEDKYVPIETMNNDLNDV